MSICVSHIIQTFRNLAPVSLTKLVNFSIWHTYQILFLIAGIISVCFRSAVIAHPVAVAKCTISLLCDLVSPFTGLFNRNSQRSSGIVRPKSLCSQSLICSHMGYTRGQDHSICKRSASSPHCFGHNGEYPGTNLGGEVPPHK
ncbi:hypothetical protein FKM82_013840 [Ascaphus truei]